MAEVTRDIRVRTTRTTTVSMDEAEAAKIIREAIKAPEGAAVKFVCEYEPLQEVQITWTEKED